MRSDIPANLRVLRESITEFGNVRLCTDEAGMNAYLEIEWARAGTERVVLEAFLEEAGVVHGLQKEAMDELCRQSAPGRESGLQLVALGSTVKKGRDGFLDYAKRPSEPQIVIASDEEKVNYRELRKFDNINQGDTLATLVPPAPGSSGADIFGRVTPPPTVREFEVSAGDNVRFDETSGRFFATAPGHLVYRQKTLSVEPVYEVAKNLDMHYGNIRFIGLVTVGGDIRDDFEVTAGTGITVRGTVEAATLVSGGDIRIQGGVTGKGRGKIQTKGQLSARYLNEVTVICNGDVIVEKEIVNSTIHTLGRVILKKGSIMGGEVVALKGIQTCDAGSEMGTPTTLAAGLHYKVFAQLRTLDSRLVERLNLQQNQLATLHGWLTKAEAGERVDSRRHRQIEDGVAEVRTREETISRLSLESSVLRETFRHQAIPCISVERLLHEGVTIVTGMYDRTWQEERKGPLTFSPDELKRIPVLKPGALIQKIWEEGGLEEYLTGGSGTTGQAPQKVVTLPEVEELYQRYSTTAGTRGRKNKTILVAEDQTNMRLLLVRQLEAEGYDVLQAEDGRQVLAHLLSVIPDCCLMDVNMPKLDGFSTLKAMRGDERFARIPVIMCTAQGDRDSILKAHGLTTSGYILKPFQIQDVKEKIAAVLASIPEPPAEDKEAGKV